MGCCGEREKAAPIESQRWEYITLSDFNMTSSLQIFAYLWFWILAIIGVAVYGVDTFTAINLLAFDKWSSKVQPEVPFKYSKWIFAACIMFSWALLIVEWIRAVRVIRRGGVAESYMDYLAANAQCMKKQGWKRFLVFSELTKSKRKMDYIAFFVYFSFQTAIRILIAEGPRQVLNAITLYAVMDANLLVHGGPTAGHSAFEQFFLNLQALADENLQQTIILSSMLFTLVLWVISAICLLIAILLYLVFLWHYIPQSDGRLSVYCRRKIDKRLEKIVEKKVQTAIEEEERKARKQAARAAKKDDRPLQPQRQPTLPQLGSTPEAEKTDKMPEFGLNRTGTSTTVSTLPLYESRPSTSHEPQRLQRQPTLPDMGLDRPTMPSRAGTSASNFSTTSYDSNAPLLANAGFAGDPPLPSLPPMSRQTSDSSFGRPGPPPRSMTGSTVSRMTPGPRSFTPMDRSGTPLSQRSRAGTPMRSNTGFSFDQAPQHDVSPISPDHGYGNQFGAPRYQTPGPMSREESQSSPFGRPPRGPYNQQPSFSHPGPQSRNLSQSSHASQQSFSRPNPYSQPQQPPSAGIYRTFSPLSAEPTSTTDSYEMTHQPAHNNSGASIDRQADNSTPYTAFNPGRSTPRAQEGGLPSSLTPVLLAGPKRTATFGHGPPGEDDNYFGHVGTAPKRSVTAPIEQPNRAVSGYGSILDSYGSGPSTPNDPEFRGSGSRYTPSPGHHDRF